ncbi:general stress protein [Edaphobacillus lindanitolerans]|uniref:Heat induced stress protein YflT n=1 Tax=Edaphobacillus lindanitolerans TaxID=550447 RepID=A0A1U7PHZ9_9BACI|nr:general stress protein [Edaphobacillus lindanitolerans]SIT70774.1 Heat induced stress protein YflT [Edaphobacillus lindanitolerans]
MVKVLSVENGVQARDEIEKLVNQGYDKDDIYLFAHYQEREDDLAKALDVETPGIGETGFFQTMKNFVAKRGDELRSEFEGVGLSKQEADQYEKVLDEGKLVLVAQDNA